MAAHDGHPATLSINPINDDLQVHPGTEWGHIQNKGRLLDMWRHQPHIHYNPEHTAAYAVDKTTLRVLYTIAASQQIPIAHLDIKSAFTAEACQHHKPVYIHQLPRADRTITHPNRPIGKLHLKLYGTKTTCLIYYTGLHTHLIAYKFHAAASDPCLYIRRTPGGMNLAAVMIDDLLVVATTQV